MKPIRSPLYRPLLGLLLALPVFAANPAQVISSTESLLPRVPDGLRAELFAREPLVRNPCAMTFDARGRLFVGHGPQYRNPKPDTPPDSVVIVLDTDGDGMADTTKTFATGLNCIQGLAWRGRDLWVANSPDLTIVRDLDGDDEADEYVRVYTDLGNIEHALHGLNWAPDGKLYFSTGTSKGLTQAGRVAPKPFRELWGVQAPQGTPDFPPPVVFTRENYKSTYQDPRDNWGREGGVLRCDDMGANLEIVSRGTRNPWDIAFDSEFNWLGTDNDQYDGDRVIMPFFGAHFGWAHAWSAHWTGDGHLPTAPISGPVFAGSGTGVVYYDSPHLPPAYRGVWFINDWLRKTTFVYRPRWEGALLQPAGGNWEEFALGRGALFQPVDIATGPDGALYITGWGKSYGAVYRDGEQVNEGRVFRISWPGAPAANWNTTKRAKSLAQWTFAELADDLGGILPIWRVDAQNELVRRGPAARAGLIALLEAGNLETARETWALWTLGRIAPRDRTIDNWFATKGHTLTFNARVQSIRILAHRIREFQTDAQLPSFVVHALADPEPRVRFAAVQSIGQARQKQLVEPLCALAATEKDRVTFYATWHALRQIARPTEIRKLLDDSREGVRVAALLALLESDLLDREAVEKLVNDRGFQVAGIAAQWIARLSGNPLVVINPAPGDFTGTVKVKLLAGIKPAALRWTKDGSEPTPPEPGDRVREGDSVVLDETTTLTVALFSKYDSGDGPAHYRKVGGTVTGTWTRRGPAPPAPPIVLEPRERALTAADVLPLVQSGNIEQGKRVFAAAGCFTCHRVEGEGQTFAPDLTAMGDKADASHIIQSMLEPNAAIAEGFSLQTISTRDGKSYAGILKEETNRILTLVQADGQPVGIDKESIVTRESVHTSVMPSFERVFSARQMADVVAWLLSQRSQALEQTLPSVNSAKRSSNSREPRGAGSIRGN